MGESVEITTTPRRTVVRSIRVVWQPSNERAEFWMIPEKGRKVQFHWMDEPRSGEFDEAQTAVKRLCGLLGVPFEYEEK